MLLHHLLPYSHPEKNEWVELLRKYIGLPTSHELLVKICLVLAHSSEISCFSPQHLPASTSRAVVVCKVNSDSQNYSQ